MIPPASQPALDGGSGPAEVASVLEVIRRTYGYDFTDYARPSITRRLLYRLEQEKLPGLHELGARLAYDRELMERLLLDFSINTTAMFRDPPFWRRLRETVLPLLATYPTARLWSVGCSSGEEPWSLAILLREAGLAARVRIYATDFNEAVLARARAGVFPLTQMRANTENYLAAGGREEFAGYYTAAHGAARFHPDLAHGICFAPHNLVTDAVFNEFQLILCRNVLIYFNRPLQDRVHGLLWRSLLPLGVLGLGDKESLRFSPHAHDYAPLDERQKLYQRKGGAHEDE